MPQWFWHYLFEHKGRTLKTALAHVFVFSAFENWPFRFITGEKKWLPFRCHSCSATRQPRFCPSTARHLAFISTGLAFRYKNSIIGSRSAGSKSTSFLDLVKILKPELPAAFFFALFHQALAS